MKNLNKLCIAFFLTAAFSQTALSQLTPENIWVTFENQSDVPVLIDGRLHSSNEEVQGLINEFNITSVEQALSASKREALQKVYDVTCLCDAQDLSARIINTNSSVLTKPEEAPKYELLANDPDDYETEFVDDYALDLIDAKGAWEYTHGDSNIVLGISDGNFYTNHEDLESEFVSINTVPSSVYYYYHGTAVATTAAGATDNEVGKSAIGYNCKLGLVSMNYNYVIQLSYEGAAVINLSWASGCYNSSYVQAIINEVYDNGTIIVAAAGNGGTCGGPSNLVYPAAHDHVIAVSSVGPNDNHERTIGDPTTTFQHNSSVDICAPGYDVALTVSPGWYLLGNGTSFAAPYVTGTIGLMLSVNPCLTFEEVEAILKETAVDIDALNPNYAGLLGAGRMNSKEAVRLALETVCEETPIIDEPVGGDVPTMSGTIVPIGTTTTVDQDQVKSPGVQANSTNEEGSRVAGEVAPIKAVVFPNPTKTTSTVVWDINENMEMYVTDVNGAVVHQQEVTKFMNRATIEVKERGVYFVRLMKEGEQVWSDRMIKM